ncbi:hypothetical protein AO398_09345 [Methylobacterium sp. GXS13]|uniref:hypothetical protein n=1 Tax=Methylobacterium sp. GXS13 TaxID=1730094 RepID=UPI00071C1BC9|nr:hypothetical protein [Methylobacterium sp. GXS13]KST56776.1 hypothetical protein AO398_09345 [Methylobacterium sp. GXS13]
MNRVSKIADYLLSTGIGDTEAAWKAEVLETICLRWPDATAGELTAAFEIVMLETGTALLRATTDQLNAGALAPHRSDADAR